MSSAGSVRRADNVPVNNANYTVPLQEMLGNCALGG